MLEIATAHVTSAAPPSAFFERWADTATWPEWNADTEWVRLDGPFAEGATGVLKPRGGPKVRFVVEVLVPDREFTDVSSLVGARLTFRHRVAADDRGSTTVDVAVTLRPAGPPLVPGHRQGDRPDAAGRPRPPGRGGRGGGRHPVNWLGVVALTAGPTWGHRLRRGLVPLTDGDVASSAPAMTPVVTGGRRSAPGSTPPRRAPACCSGRSPTAGRPPSGRR